MTIFAQLDACLDYDAENREPWLVGFLVND